LTDRRRRVCLHLCHAVSDRRRSSRQFSIGPGFMLELNEAEKQYGEEYFSPAQ
jgi:hypothetical protein